MPTVKGGSTTVPYLPKQIEITLDNAGANGQEIRVVNTTSGDVMKAIVQGDTALVDLANSASGWSENQVMLIKTNGEYFGSATLTLDANTGGQTISLSVTQASTTNAGAIN